MTAIKLAVSVVSGTFSIQATAIVLTVELAAVVLGVTMSYVQLSVRDFIAVEVPVYGVVVNSEALNESTLG